MLKKYALICGAGMVLCAALVLGVEASGLLEPAQLTGHGWFAFALAAFFCILVSAVLFALLFFSSRSGHDEEIDIGDE